MEKKNLTLSIILSLIFGPIGLLYSSIFAGAIAIVFSVILVLAFAIGSEFEIESILLLSGLIIRPIIIAWGALIVKEKNNLIDIGENFSSEVDIKLLNEAIQIYLISLALCFMLIALLTQINENNFMQNSIFPFIIVTMLIMITLIGTFKKGSSSHVREVQKQDN